MKLTIANCPSNDLAKTNLAFISDKESWAAQVAYVEVASWVFSVRPHPLIERGYIGLNTLQRKVLRESTNNTIDVEVFQPPTTGYGFDVALVNVEIDLVSKKASKVGNAGELDAPELSAHLLRHFGGQVWGLEQYMMFEFQGTNYLLNITNIMSIDKAGEQVVVSRGRLVATTAFVFGTQAGAGITIRGQRSLVAPQLFKARDVNFEKLGIGGLDQQFEQIFRRAFASRVLPPSVIERLGIHHVKGVLLHGPPGTGKTLIARQIGKMLNGKEPKVVNGPEVLNKYVGASEENIRNLFKDAEDEQLARGDASDLHVIIFDEIDAICKARGSVSSGSGVHDTVVNQLLTKIDGVDALNNILLIGMTNRKDMLDEALLRPGRLEVQIEIGLPDDKGRLQILKIHTNKMSVNSFLAHDVELWDLAVKTKNFSGAEIEGLVKSATSFALNRQVDVSDLSKPIDEDNLKVCKEDFDAALAEVKPAFGAVTETLEQYRLNGIIDSGPRLRQLLSTCRTLVEQVRNSDRTPLLSLLLEGAPGAGKTALAATIGMDSEYPFVKVVSADNMVGFSEPAKAAQISKIFEDAYRSPLSLVVLDDIERLLEYVPIGPRFSNTVLQTILVLLKKPPPQGRRLLVLGTTSSVAVMEDMGITAACNVTLNVPRLKEAEMRTVFTSLAAFHPTEVDMAVASLLDPEMPIKRLLLLLDMARQDIKGQEHVPIAHWSQVVREIQT